MEAVAVPIGLRPFAVTFGAGTDVGRVRDQNEDNFLVDRKLRLYIVCDGMGGHLGGEIASAAAVNVVREVVVRRRAVLDGYDYGDTAYNALDVLALLEDAVQEANLRIFERGHNNPTQRGMGTTLSLLLLARDQGFIAHVGDTRIYRKRGNAFELLTEDHSLVNEMARSMNVSVDTFDKRLKNAITRAVGVRDYVEVDTFSFELEAGDRYLLASDGLHGLVDDPEIHLLMDSDTLQESVSRMIDSANAAGGKDNITALVVEIGAPEGAVDGSDRDAAMRVASVFRGLSEQDILRIACRCAERTIPAGDVLVSQGRALDGMYLVVRGRPEISFDGMSIGRVEAGGDIGANALFGEATSPCTIKAAINKPLAVCVLTRANFDGLAAEHPVTALRLASQIARVLSQRLWTVSLATRHPLAFYPTPITAPRQRSGDRTIPRTEDAGPRTQRQSAHIRRRNGESRVLASTLPTPLLRDEGSAPPPIPTKDGLERATPTPAGSPPALPVKK